MYTQCVLFRFQGRLRHLAISTYRLPPSLPAKKKKKKKSRINFFDRQNGRLEQDKRYNYNYPGFDSLRPINNRAQDHIGGEPDNEQMSIYSGEGGVYARVYVRVCV